MDSSVFGCFVSQFFSSASVAAVFLWFLSLACSEEGIGMLFFGDADGTVVMTELPLAGKAGGIFF